MQKKKKGRKEKIQYIVVTVIFILIIMLVNLIYEFQDNNTVTNININSINNNINHSNIDNNVNEIPDYSGKNIIEINNNIPYFTENDMQTESFVKFSDLDKPYWQMWSCFCLYFERYVSKRRRKKR